jgi:hypothetical protein
LWATKSFFLWWWWKKSGFYLIANLHSITPTTHTRGPAVCFELWVGDLIFLLLFPIDCSCVSRTMMMCQPFF